MTSSAPMFTAKYSEEDGLTLTSEYTTINFGNYALIVGESAWLAALNGEGVVLVHSEINGLSHMESDGKTVRITQSFMGGNRSGEVLFRFPVEDFSEVFNYMARICDTYEGGVNDPM